MLRRLSTSLSLLLLVAACGRPASETVKAIDLASGEVRSFASGDDVPAGWATCSDGECAEVPETVPCQSLGESVCERRPGCRLEELWCSSPGCSGSAGTPDGPATPNVPGTPDTPGEPGDSPAASPAGSPGSSGGSDGEQPPGPAGILPPEPPPGSEEEEQPCQSTPPICQRACVSDTGGVTVSPPVPDCPAVAPPPPEFCASGELVAVFDAIGCVARFECFDGCPTPTNTTACSAGEAVPVYDSRGCVVSHTCEQGNCAALIAKYQAALDNAAICDPGLAGAAQCTKQVPSRLGCGGCPTSVNGANHMAINALDALQAEWNSLGCDQLAGCVETIPCFAPQSIASCQAQPGGGGTCQM